MDWRTALRPARYWQDMPSSHFSTLSDQTVVVLPVGAIEQHGPHLPVYVDACLNHELLTRALKQAPEELPLTALPMQHVGKSDEHISFPGTLTLSAETLTRLLIEIGQSVHRAGLRRLILLNSHGGQPQVLDIVARTLRVTAGMFVVNAAWSKLATGLPPGLFSDRERTHGIHGGEIETSLMLHLRPDLVDMSKAKNFVSWGEEMAQTFNLLTPEGRVGFGWQVEDLNPDGACGDAAAADAERGRVLAECAVAGFIKLAEEVSRYPLERIRTHAASNRL